ncbi:hypothetical protein ECPA39_1382, partial [Escherichia coli PA39]
MVNNTVFTELTLSVY